MEGYICHLNVVIFVSLHFGRTPSNQVWVKRGKKRQMKNAGNPLQLRAVSVQYSQTITEEKSCLTGGWKERGGKNEKPQEQEKRMTSPFCHSCELAPLCFMEIGID